MKIAQFTPAFLPQIGGAEIVVHNLALHQWQQGHDVCVVTNFGAFRKSRLQMPYAVRPLWPRSVAYAPTRAWARTAVGRLLRLYQRYYQFDVWHIHTAYAGAHLAMAGLADVPVPTVVTCHGQDVQISADIQYGYRQDPAVDTAVRRALSAADHLIAISAGMERLLIDDLQQPPHKITAVPNGVNLDQIENHTTDRAQLRRKLGWPADTFIILTVGRNHRKKGYALIPNTAARLRETIGPFQWWVVGGGVEQLQPQVDAAGVADCVRLRRAIGPAATPGEHKYAFPTADLIDLYRAADLFVLPSHIESFGVVLLEAMAAGLPIVTTDVPGCRDLITHGRNGLLAARPAAADLADPITDLYHDAARRKTLVDQARQDVRAYAWPQVAAQHETLYRRLIDHHQHAGATAE